MVDGSHGGVQRVHTTGEAVALNGVPFFDGYRSPVSHLRVRIEDAHAFRHPVANSHSRSFTSGMGLPIADHSNEVTLMSSKRRDPQFKMGRTSNIPRTQRTNSRGRVSSGLLLKIPEAAHALAVGRSTIYNLVAEGELETVHIGRSIRVVAASMDEFIDRQRDRPDHDSRQWDEPRD